MGRTGPLDVVNSTCLKSNLELQMEVQARDTDLKVSDIQTLVESMSMNGSHRKRGRRQSNEPRVNGDVSAVGGGGGIHESLRASGRRQGNGCYGVRGREQGCRCAQQERTKIPSDLVIR